ncbi:hypothetical protein GCM10023185_18760 [Hymenobacter saemangeumensis]|uniref:Carboxypeptidase regulatory-like domain-containing protein n=2 Tax=Hymenobacter saemangeumensis TaxID=1084522 RepID=A0ABP8IC51_9BACT
MVLDDSTGKPIDSVKINFFEEGDFIKTDYTDSTGVFSFSAGSKGVFMTKKCEREFMINFSKRGYIEQDFNDDAPSTRIEVRLKK